MRAACELDNRLQKRAGQSHRRLVIEALACLGLSCHRAPTLLEVFQKGAPHSDTRQPGWPCT